MTDEELLIMNGGQPIRMGGELVYDFGFRPGGQEWNSILDQTGEDDGINITGPRVILTDYARSVNKGNHPLYNWQLTGSCVSGGGQNALTTRIGIEVALLPQAERFVIPFTLLAYGKSRFNLGWNREGEGAVGSEFAKELGRIGVLPVDDPRLPKYHACGPAIVYDRGVELAYSAVKNHPSGLDKDSIKYTTKYVRVRDSEDAVRQLRKGRPLTWCGNWGGLTQVPLEQGYRLNRHATSWNHQQSCLGFAEDTPFGLLFLIVNQWYFPTSECKVEMSRGSINRILQAGEAKSVHGEVDKNLPACSYWIKPKDMDYQCRQSETMALYDVMGFGGQVGPTA